MKDKHTVECVLATTKRINDKVSEAAEKHCVCLGAGSEQKRQRQHQTEAQVQDVQRCPRDDPAHHRGVNGMMFWQGVYGRLMKGRKHVGCGSAVSRLVGYDDNAKISVELQDREQKNLDGQQTLQQKKADKSQMLH